MLKNSYYDIGGIVISLYEIEQFILKQTSEKTKFTENFDKIIKTKNEYKKILLQCENSNEKFKFLKFGISYPIKVSPTIRIYFPINLEERLKANAYGFLSKHINIDVEQGSISIPETLTTIDESFKNNISYYAE